MEGSGEDGPEQKETGIGWKDLEKTAQNRKNRYRTEGSEEDGPEQSEMDRSPDDLCSQRRDGPM
jgi:hypothetical protein